MSINLISAFECTTCNCLYRLESDASDCINAHIKLENEQKIKDEAIAKDLQERDWLRLNLLYPSQLPELLQEVALKRDNFLSVQKITYRVSKLSQYDYLKPINPDDEDMTNEQYRKVSGTIEGIFKSKTGKLSVFDFIKRNRGLITGGGNGGEKFSFEYRYLICDFPHIKELYKELAFHLNERTLHLREQAKLDKEHLEYLDALKFADIRWQYLTMEIKDLKMKLAEFEKQLRDRNCELSEERPEQFKNKLKFDSNRYLELANHFEKR